MAIAADIARHMAPSDPPHIPPLSGQPPCSLSGAHRPIILSNFFPRHPHDAYLRDPGTPPRSQPPRSKFYNVRDPTVVSRESQESLDAHGGTAIQVSEY